MKHQLESEFLKRGIASERLTFYTKKSIPDYLALHKEIDLILDTFPYNGGTTTGFALWMGVPILTYVWDSLPGRASFFWLSSVGLQDEFATFTEDEFIEKAEKWSCNVQVLNQLRYQSRDKIIHGERLKPEVVSHGIERFLKIVWQRFCAKLPAESFLIKK